MKTSALALIIALGGSTSAALSQTTAAADPPAGPGMLGRFTGWFSGWDTGWETGSLWRVVTSPYTYHYSRDPEHTNVYSLGVERERADGLLFGGVYFKNSFGQPSAFLYAGQRFNDLAGVEPLFAQLSGGLLYGYKEPYQHKVPLNYKGFSPGAVLAVGWQFTPAYSMQLNFLGNSALQFQFSADLR